VAVTRRLHRAPGRIPEDALDVLRGGYRLEESLELPLDVFAPVEPAPVWSLGRPEVAPELPVTSWEPLGEVVVFELGLVDEELPVVVMSAPASAPRARGSASGRRPWAVESVEPGDAPELVRLPTPLPPPLSLHALTPASIAAAAAKVTHLRIVMDVLVEL
jgi:hypothetical protein